MRALLRIFFNARGRLGGEKIRKKKRLKTQVKFPLIVQIVINV
jgi:hypothetical protein